MCVSSSVSILGPFWVHSGSILGPNWVHFGSILGPFWVHFVCCLSGDASFNQYLNKSRYLDKNQCFDKNALHSRIPVWTVKNERAKWAKASERSELRCISRRIWWHTCKRTWWHTYKRIWWHTCKRIWWHTYKRIWGLTHIFVRSMELSPNHISTRFSQNCFPHKSLAKGWPCRFRSKGTTGSSLLDHDLGHLCRGGRIQMSGHSDFGIFNNLWASSIFSWEKADTASAAWPCATKAIWRWYP